MLFDYLNEIDSVIIRKHIKAYMDRSNEAINFQPNSAFPKELTVIFQKALDFCKAHDIEHGPVTSKEEAIIKHTRLRKLFDDELGYLLIRVIKKYTGFEISNLIYPKANSYDFIFSFAMCTHYDDEISFDVFQQMSNQIEGQPGKVVEDPNGLEAKLIKMSKDLDRVKGRIKNSEVINCSLYIPLGSFCIIDFVSNKDEKLQFTAEQIAAIYLHEIGHIFTYIEYLGDASYLGYFGNNILRTISKGMKENPKVTITQVNNLVNNNKSKIKNKSQQLIVDKALRLLNNLSPFVNTEVDIDDETKQQYDFDVSIHVFTLLANLIVTIIMMCVSAPAFMLLPFAGSDRFDSSFIEVENKNSREYHTKKNVSMIERLADEYVSRHQMSKHLNDGLMLFNKIFDELGKSGTLRPVYSKGLRDSKILKLITMLLTLPGSLLNYILFLKSADGTFIYEDTYTRLKRNINNLVDVLKDPGIDENIRNQIVDDIEYMEKAIADNVRKSELGMISKVLKFIIDLPHNLTVKPGKYILGSANADKEFTRLFEDLDHMLSNKSFYYSAKISKLFTK